MGNDSALTETPLQLKTTLRSLTAIAMLTERLPPLGSAHCIVWHLFYAKQA
jgi:hypothetical protein